MTSAHRKRKSTAVVEKPGADTDRSLQLTASQVVERLLDLLEHIGVTMPVDKAHFADSIEMHNPPHPLFTQTFPIGEMLKAWHQNPRYLDRFGSPAPLKLRGAAPSFHALAKKMVPAIKPMELLSELERLGIVTVDAAGSIRALSRSLPAFEDKELARQHTLLSLNEFIMTLRHNLAGIPKDCDQLFHCIARKDDFDRRNIPALKVKLSRRGKHFLESIDDWLSGTDGIESRKPVPPGRRVRVSVGMYLSVEDR